MKLYIFNSRYLDLEGKEYFLGGIETYISMLIDVANEIGIEPIVYQYSQKDFRIKLENVTIIGIQVNENWRFTKKKRTVFNEIEKVFDDEKDILIFATDYLNIKNSFKRVISIQHGVAWDITTQCNKKMFINGLSILKKALSAYIKIIRYSYCKTLVCVDYNFLNWYRTQLEYIPNKVKVIPNCTKIQYIDKNYDSKNIKIIFARRLCDYRGTKVFTEAIVKILKKYKNVEVTIAGSGPDKEYMQEKLNKFDKVSFTKYKSSESILIHSKHDIAIVPTVGSEGTSLSLLEAMGSKCAVIASNVGGMTNIIIDGYNGLLISPTSEELYDAIERLILDKEFRSNISEKGYETVREGFSLEKWKKSWKNILNEYID